MPVAAPVPGLVTVMVMFSDSPMSNFGDAVCSICSSGRVQTERAVAEAANVTCDAADLTFLLRHHLQLNHLFVTGLHGAQRPYERAVGGPLKLRLGFDQLGSFGNVIGHLHLLNNLTDVFHSQFKRREAR